MEFEDIYIIETNQIHTEIISKKPKLENKIEKKRYDCHCGKSYFRYSSLYSHKKK